MSLKAKKKKGGGYPLFGRTIAYTVSSCQVGSRGKNSTIAPSHIPENNRDEVNSAARPQMLHQCDKFAHFDVLGVTIDINQDGQMSCLWLPFLSTSTILQKKKKTKNMKLITVHYGRNNVGELTRKYQTIVSSFSCANDVEEEGKKKEKKRKVRQ